jgi:hypothetical protein
MSAPGGTGFPPIADISNSIRTGVAPQGGGTIAMHFHVPKPLHGWREFAGEVGIIVIAVLIALGAEQLLANLHERAQAREARSAIRGELEINMARLASRTTQRSCVLHRLAEIEGLLDSAGNGSIATPNWVGRPQFWTMQTVRWDAISQAGRAALLPPKELADYGLMYTIMRNITATMISEQADWARLRTLEHLRRPTPEMVFELSSTLQDARYLDWRIMVWTTQLKPGEAELHLNKVRNDLRPSQGACIPMTTPHDLAARESNPDIGEP